MVWVSYHGNEVPGTREDFGRHEKGDFAVASEEEDTGGGGHGECLMRGWGLMNE